MHIVIGMTVGLHASKDIIMVLITGITEAINPNGAGRVTALAYLILPVKQSANIGFCNNRIR